MYARQDDPRPLEAGRLSPHKTLGVPADATIAEIKAAYSAKVLENHPDHGGDGTQLSALKYARDRMLGRAGPTRVEKSECKICKGTGWVRGTGFKPDRCPRGC